MEELAASRLECAGSGFFIAASARYGLPPRLRRGRRIASAAPVVASRLFESLAREGYRRGLCVERASLVPTSRDCGAFVISLLAQLP